jgi:hypothetical protein
MSADFATMFAWRFYLLIAAFSVLRIHSETVRLLALAVDSIARNSSGMTRTRRVPFLARPFGSGGRPAFLALLGRLTVS